MDRVDCHNDVIVEDLSAGRVLSSARPDVLWPSSKEFEMKSLCSSLVLISLLASGAAMAASPKKMSDAELVEMLNTHKSFRYFSDDQDQSEPSSGLSCQGCKALMCSSAACIKCWLSLRIISAAEMSVLCKDGYPLPIAPTAVCCWFFRRSQGLTRFRFVAVISQVSEVSAKKAQEVCDTFNWATWSILK